MKIRLLDITNGENFELDFTPLRRLPGKDETITIGDKIFNTLGYNTVFPDKGDPYVVLMVRPPKKAMGGNENVQRTEL